MKTKSSKTPAPASVTGPYATNRATADRRAIADRRNQENDRSIHVLSAEVHGARKQFLEMQKSVAKIDRYATSDSYEARMRRADHAREIYVTLLAEYFAASESARTDRLRSRVAMEPGGIDYEG